MKNVRNAFIALLTWAAAGSLSAQSNNVQPCDRLQSTLCTGVQAVFRFSEGNDETRMDSVSGMLAFEPDGQNIGVATGKFATNGVNFSGVATSYLTIAGIPSLGGGFWTVGVWVYPPAAGSNGQSQTLLVNDYKGQSGTHIYLYNNAGSLQAKVSVVDAETDSTQTATSGTNLTLSAWNLVMAGASPWPTTVGQASLWISVNNGTKGTVTLPYRVRGSNSNLDIGARPQGGGTPYTGRMSNLTIASKAWSAQEQTNFYNGGAGLDYPFVDPAVTYTFYQLPSAAPTVTYSGTAPTGSYTDVDDPVGSPDGRTTYYYFVAAQPSTNNSGGAFFPLTAPDSGIVVNFVKIHVIMAREGGGGIQAVFGGDTSCYPSGGAERQITLYPAVYINGSTYNGGSVQNELPYWNFNASNWASCYTAAFVDYTATFTNNPATGLAWTVSDLSTMKVGPNHSSLTYSEAGTTGRSMLTSTYLEVNATIVQ